MGFKNQANNGNSTKKSATEIQPDLDIIIDLLSELNQVGSTAQERITKKPTEGASGVVIREGPLDLAQQLESDLLAGSKAPTAEPTSPAPEDFLTRAQAYFPPDYQSSQSQSSQQETQPKTANQQKSKQQPPPTQPKTDDSEQSSSSDYHSRTNDQQQPSTEEVKGISEELLRLFDYFLGQQRESEHKIGWIWYKLKEEFRPSPLEICWLSVVFQYSPYWAVFKTEELYGTAERTTILFLLQIHRQEWLDHFQRRWGLKEEPQQRQPEGRGQQQQKTQSSGQHHLTGPTLVQPTALQLLGLTFPFTLQELKRAYRRRALATHPDSGGTAEAFSSVHHAYQTLFLSLKLLKKRRL